jgi:hypothetical protein
MDHSKAAIADVKIDYALKCFEKYTLKRIEDDNRKGCWMIDKVPRSDGYVRWGIPKGSTKLAYGKETGERSFYLHHLSWYASGMTLPTPVVQHLSHLCNNTRCFNPEHLCVEDPTTNNSRKNCLVATRCPCPCVHGVLAMHTQSKMYPNNRSFY